MVNRRVATLGSVALALCVLGGWAVVANDRGASSSAGSPSESVGGALDPTTTTETTTTTAPDDASQMGERYRTCVVNAGFDPNMVQVLLDPAGVPQWVKTGYEVPAEYHVPCFRSIGGTLNENWSSYGNER